MEEKVLSIKEMQELIDMGIDVSKASMCWYVPFYSGIPELVFNNKLNSSFEGAIPTFTLLDILDILAKIYKTEPFESYYIEPINIRNNAMYFVKDWYDGQRDRKDVLYSVKEDTLLNSAFQMLKWCKENKYI